MYMLFDLWFSLNYFPESSSVICRGTSPFFGGLAQSGTQDEVSKEKANHRHAPPVAAFFFEQ
jgi:hypothetical protein